MISLNFDGCAGWIHLPPAGRIGDTAVLLCTGIGQDQSNAYRSFRLLATDLAADGYPALRFDYLGTGDSEDVDVGSLWDLWLASIDAAADRLLAWSGCEKLCLIGLRLGAAMAAIAATRRSDVVALAMLEPCLLGRPYVNQLMTEARLRHRGRALPTLVDQPVGGLEVGELHFDEASVDALRRIDLAGLIMPPSLTVGIFSRLDPTLIRQRLYRWIEAGQSLTCEGLSGLDAMLRPSQHTDEPDVDSTKLRAWLRHAAPIAPDRRGVPGTVTSTPLRPDGCTETILRFGPARQLVGVLCQPDCTTPNMSVLVIGNAGGNPRHGFARFSVELARYLARAGIASLRMDFAGLGDSIHLVQGIDARSGVFDTPRTADVSAALDELERHGFHRFALHGLCSGAYHAVQVAIDEPRIDRILAVNLPWFSLRHDPPGPTSQSRRCVETLAARGVDLLLVFGEQDPGLRQFERHFGLEVASAGRQLGLYLRIIRDLDHELTSAWMRREVCQHLATWLCGVSPSHLGTPRDAERVATPI